MLEAGRALDPKDDFPDSDRAGGSRVSILSRVIAILRGQHVQARCMSFTPLTKHLFVNDWQNPYSTPPGGHFNWFRSRQVGGRLHLWGRNALRLSDQEFKAAEQDGFGDSWPIPMLISIPGMAGSNSSWASREKRRRSKICPMVSTTHRTP